MVTVRPAGTVSSDCLSGARRTMEVKLEDAVDQVEISDDEPVFVKRDPEVPVSDLVPHSSTGASFSYNRDTSDAMKFRVARQLDYYFSHDNLFFDKWLKEKVLEAQDRNNGCSYQIHLTFNLFLYLLSVSSGIPMLPPFLSPTYAG